ncbi:bifunctional diaminohydroxyphosphoribosylaminopyrimidine deaminase/5-amino-6-(5-phosphoribosylamino)uracil reductase RibD [Actinosynnema sp. NPDC020468]|uniref:bifunctional diaminohydroxyphosphoribosylaminopyrimidine deaminase/5-amino-6-(5-phosphoribosylamino)uracil reductase RibD n=1 Tax=Actinosynnema sp. NPDC020468 TaxID=3154488 RepID=UPI0033FC156C
MRRAVALSAMGLGTTSPNPPVGCVILDRAGLVAGEGFHRRKGEAHAEVHALRAAGERARCGTAVVTLEPCNHHGRTPPCRQALLDAGVARVVIALIDPTSREEGGAARLRAAGVQVVIGTLADTARLVLDPWLHAQSVGRPHTTWLDTDHTTADVAELVAAHRASHDVVIGPNGQPSEGIPGGHGADVFNVPAELPYNPTDALNLLYRHGSRTVLVVGGAENARPWLDRRLLDEAIVYYDTDRLTTRRAAQELLLRQGWNLDRVERTGDRVRLGLRLG